MIGPYTHLDTLDLIDALDGDTVPVEQDSIDALLQDMEEGVV